MEKSKLPTWIIAIFEKTELISRKFDLTVAKILKINALNPLDLDTKIQQVKSDYSKRYSEPVVIETVILLNLPEDL